MSCCDRSEPQPVEVHVEIELDSIKDLENLTEAMKQLEEGKDEDKK